MRTLTATVDQLAEVNPTGLFVRLYLDTDIKEPWQDVTWSQLAAAVDKMAYWIDTNLGAPMPNEMLAYTGVADVRYPVMILAAMKTGYMGLLTSPRNSREGHVSLLKQTGCSKFIFTKEIQSSVAELVIDCPQLKTIQIPDIAHILQQHGVSRSYCTQRSPHEDDSVLILHSSGTTGLPKPIHIKAGTIAVVDGITQMPAPIGRRNMHDRLYAKQHMLSMMPFFHVMGLAVLGRAIYHQSPFIMLPSDTPITADLIMRAIGRMAPGALACVPSILEEMSDKPGGMDSLASLNDIFYGGAPLARSCGDKVSAVTNLHTGIGSTETMAAACMVPVDRCDWEYFEWGLESGIAMEPVIGDPARSEMVIKQLFDRKFQYVFYNFPHLSVWRTKDLFERHPTKSGLWRYVGRMDDMIVLNNGEKINPVPFEKSVEEHPWIRGALMIGTGCFQAGLILEPQPDFASVPREDLIEEVWPWIETANQNSPAHAKVWQSMLILAVARKPLMRTPKGSIYRQKTYSLYKEEIEELYSRNEAQDFSTVLADYQKTDIEAITELVKVAFHAVLRHYPKGTSDNTNIFALGADSLQILQLSRIFTRALSQVYMGNLSPQVIYKHPNVATLSEHIKTVLGKDGDLEIEIQDATSREIAIQSILELYTQNIPRSRMKDASSNTNTVILTGSTGSLGSYVLADLLTRPDVGRIYCLNRGANAATRQVQAFHERGLNTDLLNGVTEFLTADFSKPYFGLDEHDYQELKQNANIFIHNAWEVNFNASLETFEPIHIAGTRRIVDFAAEALRNVHIVFVSSIASVGNWSAVHGQTSVSEEFKIDHRLPMKQGYGESKHIAGCILAKASEVGTLSATIVRVGQLCGPAIGPGLWNKQEWLPTLIATSKSLGLIPQSIGVHDTLDWVPVDLASHAIMDLTMSKPDRQRRKSSTRPLSFLDCYNLVNPHTADWRTLTSAIHSYYNTNSTATIADVLPTSPDNFSASGLGSSHESDTESDTSYDKLSDISTRESFRSEQSAPPSPSPQIEDRNSTNPTINPVSFYEWIEALSRIDPTQSNVKKYPGLRLLEFYTSMLHTSGLNLNQITQPSSQKLPSSGLGFTKCVFQTQRAQEDSVTMRELKAIDDGLMKKWLGGWKF